MLPGNWATMGTMRGRSQNSKGLCIYSLSFSFLLFHSYFDSHAHRRRGVRCWNPLFEKQKQHLEVNKRAFSSTGPSFPLINVYWVPFSAQQSYAWLKQSVIMESSALSMFPKCFLLSCREREALFNPRLEYVKSTLHKFICRMQWNLLISWNLIPPYHSLSLWFWFILDLQPHVQQPLSHRIYDPLAINSI